MSFSRTASDAFTNWSETLSKVQNFARFCTDTLAGWTETITKRSGSSRSASDTIAGWTESASRTQGFSRSASDTIAAPTESLTRAVSAPRSASDTLSSWGEALGRILHLPRGVADTLAGWLDVLLNIPHIIGIGASTQAPQIGLGSITVQGLGLGRAITMDAGGYNMTGCTATLIAVPGPFDAQGEKLRLSPVGIFNDGLTAVYREDAEEFAIGGEWSLQLELLLPTGLIYTSPPGQVFFPPILETDEEEFE